MKNRYSRQEKIIGEKTQEGLRDKKVLIVGAGALGSVLADLLVRSGVGSVVICDGDLVEWSNLQRQTLYTEEDAEEKRPKAEALKTHLEKINRSVHVTAHMTELHAENIDQLAKGVDVILDGTDNRETRLVMNDYAFQQGIPWVYGAVAATMGYAAAFLPGETNCYRCAKGNEGNGSQSCDQIGVLSSITHFIASYQFSEAMKILCGRIDAVNPDLFYVDLMRNQQLFIERAKKKQCVSCSTEASYPSLLAEKKKKDDSFELRALCGKEVVQARVYDECHQFVSSDTAFYQYFSQKEKEYHFVQAPWFWSVSVEGVKANFFKDGRVYLYTGDMKKAETFMKTCLLLRGRKQEHKQ